MRFWDTSALVPLFVREENTNFIKAVYRVDRRILMAFITPIEVASALMRKAGVNDDLRQEALRRYSVLEANATIVDRYMDVLSEARRLISRHSLRAGDAIQLACAVIGRRAINDLEFVSFDDELRDAARTEGFPLVA